MLSSLSLESFKSFEKLDGFRLKPITVICGPNSCGKSSILQSVLLLKQTFESRTSNNTILMNGRYVRLGNFEGVIYKHSPQKKIRFDLTFTLRPQDISRTRAGRSAPLIYLLRDLIRPLIIQERRPVEYFVNVDITMSPARRSTKALIARPPTVDAFAASISFSTGESDRIPGASISVTQISGDRYSIGWKRTARTPAAPEQTSGSATAQVRFVNLLPQIVSFEPSSTSKPPSSEPASPARPFPPPPTLLPSTIYRMTQIVQSLFESFSYIGPLREEPARRYIYEDEVSEIGSKGENAAYVLQEEKTQQVSGNHYYDYESERFVPMREAALADVVHRWLEVMDIHGLAVSSVRDIIQVEMLADQSNRTKVSIADVGFGVSQIFPIIVEGLRIARGGTLILEQPEIHLHPRLQMCLADYFIALALSGKNVILETHSDHIINRLVRRIVEIQDVDLSQLIEIYFARHGHEGTKVDPVRIDPNRGVVNWPKGFFDQASEEQEEIVRAGIVRRRNQRAGAP